MIVTSFLVECTSMSDEQQDLIRQQREMFSRNRPTISDREQEVLRDAHVLICGLGGLGGPVAEQLTRAGVGHLRLVDPDFFEPTNLNRQLGALHATLGRNKAEVMAERAQAINPECRVQAIAGDFRDTESLDGMDVAADCLDDGPARLELARQCAEKKIPLVHGAAQGWYGQAGVVLPGDTRYEKLYGQKQKAREPISVLAPAVFAIAAIQAALIIKLLLNRACQLEEKWLYIDLLEDDFTCL